MFEYDAKGIYRCTICGERFSPGHAVHCNEPKQRGGQRQVRLQNIGRHIDVGMRMIHANEDDGFFDITEFLNVEEDI